jgi:peroxiredoxin
VSVFAIGYDPVETLRRFGDVYGITYPLLSDPDSEVITSIGVLNTTIEQERRRMAARWRIGIEGFHLRARSLSLRTES